MVAIERGILEEKQDEHEYLDRMEDLKKSGSEIINSFKRIGKTALSETVKDIKEDVKAAMEDAREWHDTKVQADRETAETFLRVMSEDYDKRSDKADNATMMAVFFDSSTSADITMDAIREIRAIAGKQCHFSGISDEMDGQVKFIYRTEEIGQ